MGPFQYDIAEDEIVARLQQFFDVNEVTVLVEPDDDASYKRGVQKPILTVAFSGSSWAMHRSTNEVSQSEEVSFLINFQARARRGDSGIYALTVKVKKALVGFQPSHLGRISLKKLDPLGRNEDNALWFWNLEVAATKLQVQIAVDEDLPGANFVAGQLIDAGTSFNDDYSNELF